MLFLYVNNVVLDTHGYAWMNMFSYMLACVRWIRVHALQKCVEWALVVVLMGLTKHP